MSKRFEDLAKDLASGISRRQAFGRFGAGIGAALLGLVGVRSAPANPRARWAHLCMQICDSRFPDRGPEFGACISQCMQSAGCIVNGTTVNCTNV